jgi:hypothetical protein
MLEEGIFRTHNKKLCVLKAWKCIQRDGTHKKMNVGDIIIKNANKSG